MLRLFVALYPPAEVAAVMLDAAKQLDLPPHRPTPSAQVHMTLHFIGDCREGELPSTTESVERAAAGIGGFLLAPETLITLPKRGPARLLAAQTDAPAPLLELQRRLAHRLSRRARGSAGDRFLPHFTLLRFRVPGIGTASVDTKMQVAPFQIDSISLMQSTLRSQGAEHSLVSVVRL